VVKYNKKAWVMEQENFDAKLAKLSHDIEQLDAKIEDRISSLREELRRLILGAYLIQIRDASVTYVDIRRALAPIYLRPVRELAMN
jgi:hypothetical protein